MIWARRRRCSPISGLHQARRVDAGAVGEDLPALRATLFQEGEDDAGIVGIILVR